MRILLPNLSARWWFIFIAGNLAFSLLFLTQGRKIHRGHLAVNFFDVTEGDAITVQTPAGHLIAIDGGIDRTVVSKVAGEQSFFAREIDALILTHAHEDHVNGASEILQNFPVKTVFVATAGQENWLWQRFAKIAREKNVPVVEINESKNLRFGTTIFKTIFPLAQTLETKNLNDTSLVFQVQDFGKSVLLTGDIENAAERHILLHSTKSLQSDVLKVAHHGASTSTSDEFLQATSPQLAVVCAGNDSRFDHPHQSVLQKLAENHVRTWVTKDSGDVHLRIVQDQWQVENKWQVQSN